ncbi:BREX-1 system phosphatase PglZ type A [Thiolapillus sp.]|uniref:BREX-1 system phosphatase PglZ type A n=12 Tax=Thiolapillus sp. TaxID=2017437 RepID=UPI003AF94A92
MNDRIAQALTKLFERHRIIFWYDAKKELRSDFEGLKLPGIEKLEVANNEFGVKYRLLREKPEQKFLLYREGPQPEDLDNWLLDVQLAHGEFRTDQVALWLSELELGMAFAEVVEDHVEFFKAAKRKEALKRRLESDDTPGRVRMKMLSVCAQAEPRLDAVLESLLEELSEEEDGRWRILVRCGLDSYLWQQMERQYGYHSDAPGTKDFVIELFKSCYAMETGGDVHLSSEALVFLRRWKDSRRHEEAFENLSDECAWILNIEQELAKRDFRDLLEVDYFSLIDQKIISDLVQEVVARTVTPGDVTRWVRQRRQGHWYAQYLDLYQAIDYASQFIHGLAEATLEMDSLAEGIQRYAQSWYRLDLHYRKFVFHIRSAGQAALTSELARQINDLYSNNYLLTLNDRWQTQVDAAKKWAASPVRLQREFFSAWVQPFLSRNKKVFVIISDALRYEIGDELLSRIRKEDRFDAKLEPVLSMLPSYTQLGMAALLPNQELEIQDDGKATAYIDGKSSTGTSNRDKILKSGCGCRSVALQSRDFLQMNREECRSLIREHDVFYIYQNIIDKTGDARDSEERAFLAVEETLEELVKLLKKLAGNNANNMLLTADHGFIYQDHALDESEFVEIFAKGKDVSYLNRRFVLGHHLGKQKGMRAFEPEALGLSGDMEVLIPKSINRLRVKGAGSRFVHGGASLQEVVVPVLQIHKKRKSDVRAVDVDVLRGGVSTITSGQLSVAFYQAEPVTDKVQPRTLRVGIYNQSGELISDSHTLNFDFASENARERELKLRFVLSHKADEANGQEVFLRLEEPVSGTSHYKEYALERYLIRRSFTTDFDL